MKRTLPRARDEESLLNIPLVRHMLHDRAVVLRARRVDEAWYDNGLVPRPALGFRPFYGELFHAYRGRVAEWLARPDRSPRRLNPQDRLAYDVLFLVHDYLHAWCYSYLRNELGVADLGYEKITASRLERYTFLHLLTEAGATVGLDYWWLSTVNLADVVKIGSLLTTLTISYHERNRAEYRRANAALEVQRPAFFADLAGFYCTGDFFGFDAKDIHRSPALYGWLHHELSYAQSQRAYIRQWLRHLGGHEQISFKAAAVPVRCNEKWQRLLMARLGEALWQKVKEDVLHALPRAPKDGPWKCVDRDRVDFRFVDVTSLDEDVLERADDRAISTSEFNSFFVQYVSMFRFDSMSPRRRAQLLPLVQASKGIRATLAVMEGAERLPACAGPRDIFMLA